MTLDLTNISQIEQAVGAVETLDVLINDAGVAIFDDLSDASVIQRHLADNLFGTLNVTHAFLPLLTHSKGAIVNIMSTASFVAIPIVPAYSISKAALFA